MLPSFRRTALSYCQNNCSVYHPIFSYRNDYVAAYVNYRLNESVKEQFEAFSSGFLEVCGGHVLRFFHPQELMAMVIGNEEFNWDELEEVCRSDAGGAGGGGGGNSGGSGGR